MKVIMKWLHSAYVNDTMLFFKGAIVFLIGPFDEKLKGLAVIILVDLILGDTTTGVHMERTLH